MWKNSRFVDNNCAFYHKAVEISINLYISRPFYTYKFLEHATINKI